MYTIWCVCRYMQLPTKITSFKSTEKRVLEEFNEHYSRKYELKKIVPCT